MERDLIRKFFLRANPNPNREGCPGSAVLKAIAENTLAPNHPARLHLADCSPCFAEFRQYKDDAKRHRTQLFTVAVAAIAALLVVGILSFFLFRSSGARNQPVMQAAIVDQTLNLWDRGAVRGGDQESAPGKPINLPQKMVRLQVILPRLSEPGKYTIGIAPSRNETNIVQGSGIAAGNGAQETVTVTLDLRSAKPGVYFLTTTHDRSAASYYYPVTVQN